MTDPKWKVFYDRWRDFVHKTKESVQEINAFEEDTDVIDIRISKEVWDLLLADLERCGRIKHKENHRKACLFGVNMRPIHMEVLNQVVIQREGITLVARLFHIPSKFDENPC